MRKDDFDVYMKDGGGDGAEHPVLTGPYDTIRSRGRATAASYFKDRSRMACIC